MKKLSLLTAAAFGVLLAASTASAQTVYESVDVTAPRAHGFDRDAALGAPYKTVSMSEAVSYRDLDLRTDEGADRLNARVRIAARSVCNRLDHMYPISDDSDASCMQGAIATGQERADAAVNHVRYIAYLNEKRHMAMLEKSKKPVKHVATRDTNKTKKHAA